MLRHLALVLTTLVSMLAAVQAQAPALDTSNQAIAADLDSLLKGCGQPGPIIDYLKLRRSYMADQPGKPRIRPGAATSDILYPRDVTWRGLQVDLMQYEQRDSDKQWRLLVQFQASDHQVFEAFYQPLNASRQRLAKDSGLETGFLEFNGRTSVICQNARGPWMTQPALPGGPNLLDASPAQAAPADTFTHPAIMTAEEVKAIGAWTPEQWDAFMRPLLSASRGRLNCRPARLMYVFIPPPYDRLITDHSALCDP